MKKKKKKIKSENGMQVWDKKNEKKASHRKFESLWKGPFKVIESIGPSAVKLSYLNREILPYTYNGQDLKLFI